MLCLSSFFLHVGLFYASWAGIAFGTTSVLVYMVFIIIYDLDDKYNARYIIPILGIQLGNAMSAAALGVVRVSR